MAIRKWLYGGLAGSGRIRGGGQVRMCKTKKGGSIEGDYSSLSAVRMGGQGGDLAASGLNDLVLVERSLIQHLQSPLLFILFFLFQN